MRLWHKDTHPVLSKQRLLGQHRECCAMRGLGWNKKHSTVQYALDDEYEALVAYSITLMKYGTEHHGIQFSPVWLDYGYRGKSSPREDNIDSTRIDRYLRSQDWWPTIHNVEFLKKDIHDLVERGDISESDAKAIINKKDE